MLFALQQREHVQHGKKNSVKQIKICNNDDH